MKNESISALQNRQNCLGDAAQFVGEMDGNTIPVVLFDEEAEGDKRKTRKTEWQEAKVMERPGFAQKWKERQGVQ